MKKILIPLRLVFGLFWLVFGLNGLLHLFPTPTPTGAAAEFMGALEQSGYVMPLTYSLQMLCGILLLSGYFVPLALLLLAPVIANIVLYDTFLNPSGLMIGIVVAALHLALMYSHRHAYKGLFSNE